MQDKVAGVGARLLWPLGHLAEARGLLFPWVPVFLGIGIALYFALPYEPGWPLYSAVAVLAAAAVALYRLGPELAHPLAVIAAAVAFGFLAAGLRAHLVAAPMLEFRYFGPVQGCIVEIDRSASDALRLTLDQVVLLEVPAERTPVTVRVSVQDAGLMSEPGQVVLMTATLAAPEGPAAPGGFDFRRMAFFNRLGAVGYSRSPVMIWQMPAPGAEAINRLRRQLSAAMMAAMPGDAGAFAAAAMTGDRSAIRQDTVQALRDSNLAHLLAISGMNMAFLTGFVFMAFRYGMALVPPLALRSNAKKIAAVAAFAVALFYLLLSGANVATERAFLMVAVMLGAVLLDRRALTLRSVALAGLVLLLAEPESLGEPGFQLSFAATVVLIAGFEALDRRLFRQALPRWLMPVFTLVLTSVLAGRATAPFAAATFNRFTDYGLLANLLTVPAMGAVVMPAGAVAALIAPFGLAWLALWVMGLGVRWILFVAHWIADLDGSITAIPEPAAWALPLITLGGLWLIAWPGRARLVGVVAVVAGLASWPMAGRPDLLITSDGRLLGLLGPEGRALSAAKGGGFAAESWLENDGDLVTQENAALRTGFDGPKGARRFSLGGLTGMALSGKGAEEKLAAACAEVDLVVIAARIETPPEGCIVIDQNRLRQTGALAVRVSGGQITVTGTRQWPRLWVGKPMAADALPVLQPQADPLVALQ